MARCMSTGFKQRQAWQNFRVSFNEPIAQVRMVPVSACANIAGMSAARQFIMVPLHNQFRSREGIVIACVVHVKMCTDEHINIVRTQSQLAEMLKYIFFLLGRRHACWRLVVGWEKNVLEHLSELGLC